MSKRHTPLPRTIAKLHALLRETETLAKVVNRPVTTTLFSLSMALISTLLQSSFDMEAFRGYSRLGKSAVVAMLIPIAYKGYTNLWQLCSSLTNFLFPNGFLYERKKHIAYQMTKKLGSQQEVFTVVKQLEALVKRQRKAGKYTSYAAWVISIALPILLAVSFRSEVKQVIENPEIANTLNEIQKELPLIQEGLQQIRAGEFSELEAEVLRGSLDMMFPDLDLGSLSMKEVAETVAKHIAKHIEELHTLILARSSKQDVVSLGLRLSSMKLSLGFHELGLSLRITHENMTFLAEKLSKVARYMQSVEFAHFVKASYDSCTSKKQLRQFKNRLQLISNTTFNPCQIESVTVKQAAVFMFNLKAQVNIKSNDAISRVIPKEMYLTAFHNILLKENIPVYESYGDKIFVGYSPLSENRAKRLKAQLFKRLDMLYKQRKIVSQLNRLSRAAGIQGGQWGSRLLSNATEQQPSMIFYLKMNGSAYPGSLLGSYESALRCFLPAESKEVIATEQSSFFRLTKVRSCLSKDKLEQHISLLENLKGELKPETNRLIRTVSVHDSSNRVRKRKMKAKRLPAASCRLSEEKAQAPVLPVEINFGNNIYHAKGEIPSTARRAYPLQIPWLPEGQGFGVVDEAVFGAVENYLSREQVLDRLRAGLVHGAKVKKTKKSSVGLQVTQRLYKPIVGKQLAQGCIKMKFTNNIRIFGHRGPDVVDESGNKRTLYIFDGPAFGH